MYEINEVEEAYLTSAEVWARVAVAIANRPNTSALDALCWADQITEAWEERFGEKAEEKSDHTPEFQCKGCDEWWPLKDACKHTGKCIHCTECDCIIPKD